MSNKEGDNMDLRVKKTLFNIKDAFFTLRKRKSVEKITVKELSEIAMINKATFYLHYRDIYDLSDSLQAELIEETANEALKAGFDESEKSCLAFVSNFFNAVVKRKNSISVLFSGNSNDFINSLEKKLKEIIFLLLPNYKNNIERDIFLSYLINGCYSVIQREFDYPEEKIVEHLSVISLNLMSFK